MAKIISEKELQKEVEDLKRRVNGDLCPTAFSGKDFEEFMDCYQKGDTIETVPLYDNSLKRKTVALVLKRDGKIIAILQRGKVPGD